MLREMMLAKIHGAMVTDKSLHYTGSLAIDPILLRAIRILPHEKIQVINLANGERMWTYAIEGVEGTGQVVLNGGMAHKGEIGDRVLIISYGHVEAHEAESLRPKVLVCGETNLDFEIIESGAIPSRLASNPSLSKPGC